MISEKDSLQIELESYRDLRLTGREVEVLRLLAEGLSNKQMAGRMFVSDHTVKFHVANIVDKMGGSRCRAVYLGAKLGLV